MRFNISLEDAHNILTGSADPVEEKMALISDVLGMVLSKDIAASINLPLFEKSAMDGYALKSSDIAKASHKHSVELSVIDETRAGFVSRKKVVSGTAVKVMTGSAIPEGADVVVRSEDVSFCKDKIKVCESFSPGTHRVKVGEDIHVGELIAKKGTVISPSLVGLLAGLGMVQVQVHRKVAVAVMSTGDELISPYEKSQPGKIFNSSLYGIMAKCCSAGAAPVDLGIVSDDAQAVARKMSEGLKQADIVITTGGTSAGDYDVVEEALMLTGAKLLFKGLAVKSGSPILAGKKDGRFILSLSGNPSSAMATFDLIVSVLLYQLMGCPRPLPCRIGAVMAEGYLRRSPVRRLLRARLFRQNGIDFVELTDHHSRGMVESIIESNFFIDIPAGSGYIHPGELVWGFPVENLNQLYSQITGLEPADSQYNRQHYPYDEFYRTA